ncbi:cholecystokinin receptor type A [Drosophila grimshawi]|uniref:GH12200 n=1 Tax=Drosophila grimshawi TaxID=7222 RepID=B4JJR3_DROGR|nr:cholecystokinin receptor type A [Drosophila grimshawi]EDV99815.1 GH12200 [Drosophila grimshawi]
MTVVSLASVARTVGPKSQQRTIGGLRESVHDGVYEAEAHSAASADYPVGCPASSLACSLAVSFAIVFFNFFLPVLTRVQVQFPRDSLTIGAIFNYRRLLSALAPLTTNAALQLNASFAAVELYGGASDSISDGINGSDLYIYGNELHLEEISSSASLATSSPLNAITVASAVGSGTIVPMPMAPTNRSMSRVIADVPIWVIPCYSIILLCAVVGNLLVVLTLVQNRRMRTITNVFLLNLAISDILLGVLCMPVTLVGTLLRHFIFGEFLCKLLQFAQAASVAVSSWTLVAISCERYYAICHPLRSRTWQTINHANKIIAFIWLGSLVCMTPIAYFSQLMPTSRQGLRKCREQWPAGSLAYERAYNIFLDLALLVLPLLALSFAYMFITRTLYVSMRNERAMNFGSSGPDDVLPAANSSSSTSNNIGCSGFRRPNQSKRLKMRQEASSIDAATQLDMQQQFGAPQYYYADGYSHGGSKRRLFGSNNGRQHLYCMRSASVKSVRHQQKQQYQNQQQLNGSDDCCVRLQRLRHQHQQQHLCMSMTNGQGERRKSLSTPSLRITEATLRRSNDTKSLESKKRVVKMLFVLVLEFFICWTPLYVINTLTMLIGPAVYEYVDYTAISFLQLLAYSSSCCNPITYCFMNANFRRAFVDTFKGMRLWDGGRLRFCRRRSQNETNLSVAGNSIALANSAMSSHTILESPRL